MHIRNTRTLYPLCILILTAKIPKGGSNAIGCKRLSPGMSDSLNTGAELFGRGFECSGHKKPEIFYFGVELTGSPALYIYATAIKHNVFAQPAHCLLGYFLCKRKLPMSLQEAPDHLVLAVDLIELLEDNPIPAQTVLAALAVVRRDFERKLQSRGWRAARRRAYSGAVILGRIHCGGAAQKRKRPETSVSGLSNGCGGRI